LLFINFSYFKLDTENNANFDAVSRNALTLTPFNKKQQNFEVYECKGYNARQLITVSEQRLNEEQHQQAAGEIRNSRQASEQRQTQCAKRRHSWVAVAESGKFANFDISR